MFTCDVYNADCVDILKTLADTSVDCVFVDPPYNTKNKTNKAATYDRNTELAAKNWQSFHANWDDIIDYSAWATEWLEQSKRVLTDTGTIFICGTFHNIPDVAMVLRATGFYTIQWIQWCIPNAFPNLAMTKPINANQTMIWARKGKRHFYDKEAAKRYNDGKNLRDYWLINQDTRGKWKHPSKKPVELVYRALDISVPKDKSVHIVDFFSGSGSTGESASLFAKTYANPVHCTLVDKDNAYAQMSYERTLHGCQISEIESGGIRALF